MMSTPTRHEVIGSGGTLAPYSDKGITRCGTATLGERLDRCCDMDTPANTRQAEIARGVRKERDLGIKHQNLGYRDSGCGRPSNAHPNA